MQKVRFLIPKALRVDGRYREFDVGDMAEVEDAMALSLISRREAVDLPIAALAPNPGPDVLPPILKKGEKK